MTESYRHLDEVRMRRDDVLDIIKENRDAHREVFEAALEGYKVKAIEILGEHIEKIRANAPERLVFSLPFPEDHSDDYERTILMLEHSLDREILLDADEFARYIMDDWGWKQNWTATVAAYTKV